MSRPFNRLLAASTALAVVFVPLSAPVAQSSAPKPVAAPIQAISAKDKAEGAKAHPELVAQFGGAETGPYAAYVESVGKGIAVQSGLSNAKSDFTVTLLNSPVNNAFAIPGGYIYTTRQLVALMNNEAELAGVLGHETAHVAARHGAKRQSAATRNAVIGVLGTVLSGVLLGNSQIGQVAQNIFSTGSQLLTLKYSRSQETEADNLGIAYLKKAGYDPRAMSTVLQSLAEQNALEARLMGSNTRVPAWASTHPDPASRVRSALAQAGANPGGTTNRDLFLSKINGIMYGDDPKQGVVDGRKFTHPDLKMAFEAPSGFYVLNGAAEVTIGGQAGKAQFGGAAYAGDLDAYVRAVFARLGESGQAQLSPDTVQRTTVNGIPAAYAMIRANSGDSQVDVTVFAYEWGKDSAFHFITLAPAGNAAIFDGMFGSMRRISATEAAAVKPRKLVVVTAKAGDTVKSLAGRMAYADAPEDRLRVLNGLAANATIAPGQKIKLITY